MGLTRLRLLVLAALFGVLGAAACGVFDEFLWVLVVAPIIPVALLFTVVGRGTVLRVGAVVVGIVAATALAVASEGGTASDAIDAITDGVQRILSTEWPSPTRPDLVGTVAAGLAIGAGISSLLATSRRWHLLPLLPVAVLYVLVVALAAPLGVQPLALVTTCLLAVLFAMLRNDGSLRERWLLLRGERRLVPLLGIAGLLVLALSLPIAFATRADPRDEEPPALSAVLLDPIEANIALRALDPAIVLHRIESNDAGGDPLPTRWRTAAMSSYDGRRWAPEITVRPIGSTLGPVTGDTVDVGITILDDELSLVPLPGDPVSVSADVETDPGRTVVRLVERPQPGDVVNLVSNVSATDTGAGSTVAVRPVDENVAGLTGFATTLGGEGAVVDQLLAIESTMRNDFALDSDAPGGGLQRALIDRFLRDTERGNEEQFATAFALLARSLGVEARIATGFIVDDDEGQLELTSADAAIWPEVGLADGSWVAFDPVPATETSDDASPPPEPQVQTPAAPQPPVAQPPESPDDAPDTEDDLTDAASGSQTGVLLWATRVGGVVALLSLPILLAAALILGVKYRRRRRRLRAAQPHDRIRGAWASATDDLVDAGLTITRSTTDDEIASSGEPLAPDARRELHRLATLSGAATFGSPSRPDLLSQDATACLDSIDVAIARTRTRWGRVRWRLSLRSLRSATRSPVGVPSRRRSPVWLRSRRPGGSRYAR